MSSEHSHPPPTRERDACRKLEIEFASKLHRDEVLIYFESILDGLKKGSLQLKQSGKLLDLAPAEAMDIEVKGSKKADKQKLSIKLSWRLISTDQQRA